MMPTEKLARPLVQKDADAAYEHVARKACSIINDDQQEAMPMVMFMQMHDTTPGVVEDFYVVDPKLVHFLFGREGGKQLLTRIIAATLGDEDAPLSLQLRQAMQANGLRPDVAVQVSEAWAAPDNSTLTPPSQRADRQEVLVVVVHVCGHTHGQMMPITTTDGKRHVDYRPLPATNEGGVFGGNMAMQGWDDVPENVGRRP